MSDAEPHGPLIVELAQSTSDVRESQSLRWRVFHDEMGAELPVHRELGPGFDHDAWDDFCDHLLVRDAVSRRLIASTRILTGSRAWTAGGFYSQGEFDLSGLRDLPERVMEVGRTCVDPAYRGGGAIASLWAGLARYMVSESFDAMIGCASVPIPANDHLTASWLDALCTRHMGPESLRVQPLHGLTEAGFDLERGDIERTSSTTSFAPPPLLKGYLRLGAYLCGPPCYDPAFGTADVFIFLDVQRIPARYHRHFLRDVRVAEPNDAMVAGEF
ncbi:MAG: GNAT family N-acetyltransferase [Thioalkalivibrionaceae bacterium]